VTLRIAFIAPYVSNRAGPARVIASLIDRLCQDHEITVFAHTVEGIKLAKIKYYKVPRIAGPKLLGNVMWLISSTIISILSLVRKREFDIIHSHTYLGAFSADVVTSHFCERECHRLEKDHTICMPHAGIWQSFAALDDKLYRRLMVFAEGAAFGHKITRVRIVVSQRMKSDFIYHYGDDAKDITVIPNGVDLEVFNPAIKQLCRHSVRQKHSISDNDVLLMFAGSDWGRKGLRYIMEALSLLPRSDVKLLVVGSGDEKFHSQLAESKQVRERVIFVSGNTNIWEYYAASDIFVFPTLYEPFGLVILEAMASGLPVITSRIAGAAELINDGDDCLLLDDPTDVSALAEKINLLLSDPDLRDSMGRLARRTAEGFSWDRIAERTLQVYDSILERKEGLLKNAKRPADR
jgi:UDP-glucose:(heptosyl)LPS alpha-1,3-glucosyltransferase